MRAALVFLVFAASASAARIKARSSCCFQLASSGGVSGSVGQISDGQNRIGGLSAATYCIDGATGIITDVQGRGCIVTSMTKQIQCNSGRTGTPGFSISTNGNVVPPDGGTLYACPATDTQYNIYTMAVTGQTKCVQIMLGTGGQCVGIQPAASTPSPIVLPSSAAAPLPQSVGSSAASVQLPSPQTSIGATAPSAPPVQTIVVSVPCANPTASGQGCAPLPSGSPAQPPSVQPPSGSPAQPPSVQPPSVSPAQPSPSAPKPSLAACPTDLSGPYQYPHLMVGVSSTSPSQALGNSYHAHINSTTATIYNFDIPSSYAGKTCQLQFLFPAAGTLQTSSFKISGSGSITFNGLMTAANAGTTYSTIPATRQLLGTVPATPGTSSIIGSGPCTPGAYSVAASTIGNLDLRYFQDYNPPPIGLYIAVC